MTTPAFNNAKLGNTVRTEHPAFYVNQSGIIFFDGSQQLTAFTGTANETDPVFSSSVAYNITINDTGNWTSAYSWGNHAVAGYATTGQLSSVSGYLQNQIDNITDIDTFTTGVVFNTVDKSLVLTRDGGSVTGDLSAVAISGDNISIFVNDQNYLISGTSYHPNISSATSSDNTGRTYIQDILLDSNGHVTGLTTASETVINTDTYVTGAVFNTGDGDLILTLNDNTSVTGNLDGRYLQSETDPVFTGSPAYSITGGDINNWNTVYSWVSENSGNVLFSGDNISLLINDAGYITSGDLIPLSGYLSGVINLNNYDIVGTGNIFISGDIIAQSGYFDVISFNIDDESILTKGQISWDDTQGTMDIGLTDNTTIHIGEHRYYRVRNETGSVLYKGQVVYASGVHANGIIEPALYVANGDIREIRFMGLILENISNNSNGYAIDFGHLEDMDLDGSASNYAVGDESWVAGDILYVHPTVAGKLTKVEPKHSISVAIVLDPGNGNGNGRMFVRPTSYGHLNDNHDVDVSGLLNNQFLVYDSVTDYWQPSSGLYYVDGDLGIGKPLPSYKLDVAGSGHFDQGIYQKGSSDNNYFAGSVGIGGTHSSHTYNNQFSVVGGSVFNEAGGDYDFRVESTGNPAMLYVDASSDAIGIGTSTPSGTVHIRQATSPSLRIHAYAGAGSIASKADRGHIIFPNYNQTVDHVKLISWGREANRFGGMLGFNISDTAGVSREVLTIDNEANDGTFGLRTYNIPIVTTSGNVIFNTTEDNYDFTVKGDGDPELLVVDASTDRVGIGTATPSYKLDVNGTFSANSINVNDQFTFPTTDGSANQILVTNGNGVLSWQNPTSSSSSSSSYAMIHVFG
jgi:hypothetical protein